MVRRESTTNELFKDQHSVLESTSSCHETALNQCKRAQSFQTVKDKRTANVNSFGNRSLLSLDRSTKLSKEQPSNTADSYHSFGDKQHLKPEDPISVLRFNQRVRIKQKLSGEQHASTGDSYHLRGSTQHRNGDSSSVPQSPQGAVDNKGEMFREEHSSTADTYDSTTVTQHTQGNFSSALQSALRKRRKRLFGEEHSSTGDSYHSLGIIQLSLRGAALQCKEHALDIRRRLFGERHSSTAKSYDSLGDTHRTEAFQFKQRALNIRFKLLRVADS